MVEVGSTAQDTVAAAVHEAASKKHARVCNCMHRTKRVGPATPSATCKWLMWKLSLFVKCVTNAATSVTMGGVSPNRIADTRTQALSGGNLHFHRSTKGLEVLEVHGCGPRN